jgi:capsular polysaccharide biosynthesis protein
MSNELMRDNENAEISLLDIYMFFKDGWKLIAASTLAFSLAGIAYALLATPIYEATANIEMAVVTNSVVETPTVLAEKLRIPTYYSDETTNACGSDDSQATGESLAQDLKPAINKNAPILIISYRSKSVDKAKKCLEAVLENIRVDQNKISKPILSSKQHLLKSLEDKLESAEKIKHQYGGKALSFDFNDPKFSASTLLMSTLLANDREITDLRNQIFELNTALSAPQTREAYLSAPIYAPSKRVEPRRSRIVLGAALGGIFLGLFFLLGQKARIYLRQQIK